MQVMAALLFKLFEQAPDHATQPLRAQLGSPGGRAAEGLVHRYNPTNLEHRQLGIGSAVGGQDLKLRLNHLESAGARH